MGTMPGPKGFYVTSQFGQRTGQYAGMHWGTDFGNGGGSGGKPIYAAKDGTVTRAGAASGFGQWITLDHPASNGGGLTVYGHIIPEVRVGQQVKEGQRIGYINPNSATNGGVAPHLHFEWHRYVWSQPGSDRLDPMTKLAGAKWVGDTPAPSKPSAPSAPSTGGNLIFGVDIASHQNGLPLRLAKASGAEFVIMKATEGHTYRDPVFHSHLTDARAQNLIVGAYLYVWHNSTPAQMAETFAKHVNDTSIPAILDIEDNSGYSVAHWKATVAELNKRGYRTPFVYIPKWYWKKAGSPSLAGLPPLWSSNYPAGGGGLADTYSRSGGANGAGWNGYGGLNVVVWQFTEGATVGWKVNGVNKGIDGNAFRGSRAQFEALMKGTSTTPSTSQEDDMTPAESKMLREIHHQLLNPWPQLGNKTLVDALGIALDQLVGPKKDEKGYTFSGWDQLGNRTLVDAMAAILEQKEIK